MTSEHHRKDSMESDVYQLKLLVVGPSKVGKSSLCNALSKGEFNKTYIPTHGPDFMNYNANLGADKDTLFLVTDTGGSLFDNRQYMKELFYRTNIILLCYDSSSVDSLKELRPLALFMMSNVQTNKLTTPA